MDKNSREWEMAQTWNDMHDDFPPVTVPDGYRSVYLYQTASANVRRVEHPFILSVEPGESWGVISFTTDHLLDDIELKQHHLRLQDKGVVCPGSFRLISQTFKLDI